MGTRATLPLALAILSSCAVSVASAQETDLTGKVGIELNALSSEAESCTLTFMVTNGYAADIDQLVFETVLIDTSGVVDRLTLFDFGALPMGRPRVRQFAVPDLTCDALGRVLFNGLHSCVSDGLQAADCAAGLVPMTRTDVEVLG